MDKEQRDRLITLENLKKSNESLLRNYELISEQKECRVTGKALYPRDLAPSFYIPVNLIRSTLAKLIKETKEHIEEIEREIKEL